MGFHDRVVKTACLEITGPPLRFKIHLGQNTFYVGTLPVAYGRKVSGATQVQRGAHGVFFQHDNWHVVYSHNCAKKC